MQTRFYSWNKSHLRQIQKINPLDLPSDKEFVGILAQNAKELIPESVSTDEQGFLHLNNDSIIWTLLNAVKELHQRFTTSSIKERREIASVSERTMKLEAENTAKDKKIKDLEKENADFKKRLVVIEKAMSLK